MPAEKVDGNDVEQVRAAAERAVDHARRGDGPAFLECLTYRHLGHSKTDPGAYRPEGELDEWLARDPLTIAAAKLARGRCAGRGGRRAAPLRCGPTSRRASPPPSPIPTRIRRVAAREYAE